MVVVVSMVVLVVPMKAPIMIIVMVAMAVVVVVAMMVLVVVVAMMMLMVVPMPVVLVPVPVVVIAREVALGKLGVASDVVPGACAAEGGPLHALVGRDAKILAPCKTGLADGIRVGSDGVA
jgi:hypothetical protein